MNFSDFTPQRVTAVFLAAMATVFLLLVGEGGYTDITHFKYALFLILCGLYVIAVFFACMLQRKAGKCFSRPRFTAVHGLLLLFMLFTAVSAVASPYFPHTLIGYHRYEGLLIAACYVISALLVSFFAEIRPYLLWIFAASVTAFCLICFLQFLGLNPFGFYPEGLNYYDAGTAYRYEFLGTVGNADLAAAVLSLAAPAFAVALFRGKGKKRFFLLIPLISVILVTVLSKVAAAYVGVFGGLVLSVPFALMKERKKRILVFLLICCLLLAALFFVFLWDFGKGTLHELHVLLHGEWDDDFGTGRLFIWRNVLALVPERPFFGGGCDTLGQRMTAEFQRYDAETGVTYRAFIDTAHNEYLNILVNEGALALGAYLGALVLSFIAFLKNSPKNPGAAVCGAGMLGYLIQAFFGMRMCITAPFFWLLWGLLLAFLRPRKEEDKDGDSAGALF
ncbi:MAG: O-antigen ligase family protein [Clostridia bacterium]